MREKGPCSCTAGLSGTFLAVLRGTCRHCKVRPANMTAAHQLHQGAGKAIGQDCLSHQELHATLLSAATPKVLMHWR